MLPRSRFAVQRKRRLAGGEGFSIDDVTGATDDQRMLYKRTEAGLHYWDGWHVLNLVSAVSGQGMEFSKGGPKAWFAVIRRVGGR